VPSERAADDARETLPGVDGVRETLAREDLREVLSGEALLGEARGTEDVVTGSADVHLVPGLLCPPAMSTTDLSDTIDLPWRCEAALASWRCEAAPASQASFGVLDVRRAAHRCPGASSSTSSRVDQKSVRSGVPALHHRVVVSTATSKEIPPTP